MSAMPAPAFDARDERYMKVLTTLSRYGVRLPPERMGPLVSDLIAAVGTSVTDWQPNPDYAKQDAVKRKNPHGAAPIVVAPCPDCGHPEALGFDDDLVCLHCGSVWQREEAR